MHEAIAAGAIPLVVSMAEHQTRKALYAQEKGAALFLGVVEKFNESDVAKALKLTSGQLKQMHEAGRKLIDGKGIFRVVSAIEAMT